VIVGAALMVAEAHMPSHGVLGTGAAAALTAGVVLALSGAGAPGGAVVAAGVVVALAGLALAWLLLVKSLAAHGLPVRSGRRALVGRVATVRLLETGQPFTAIFAFNDLSAMGAIVALREAGINVPSDVSVVGFDDIPSAATNNPPLTTVRQPLQEMGRVAATMLLERIQSDEPRPQNRPTLILPTFVERQTTARAAGLRKAAPEPLLLRTTR